MSQTFLKKDRFINYSTSDHIKLLEFGKNSFIFT